MVAVVFAMIVLVIVVSLVLVPRVVVEVALFSCSDSW